MKSFFQLRKFKFSAVSAVLTALIFCQPLFAQDNSNKENNAPAASAPVQKGKMPIIVIPGLIGSELVNKQKNETVWFNLSRSKDDDLRLPISPNIAANKDGLVAGDILRNIKYLKFLPETAIYEKLASSLVMPGGYTEGNIDNPAAEGYQDTYYVFPYDWRRDNVENARLLIRKMRELRTKLNRPNLKFNVIGHSMGGLIARYAVRFGDAELPAGNRPIRPTWVGAKYIDKVFMVGTPNEGSFSALDSLINGFAPFDAKGINIPFVQSVSKFDTFTIPSIYQLLPHTGTGRAFGDDLQPLKLDLFNPATWEKYGWAAYQDPKFSKEFSAAEQAEAKSYFRAVLLRAKRFQEAIDSARNVKTPVKFYIIGSDCKPTLDGMIVYRDTKKNRYETIFSPESFKKTDGTKLTDKQVKELLYAKGDGVVTAESLLGGSTLAARNFNGFKTAFHLQDILFTCEVHNQLTGNPDVQRKMFGALNSTPVMAAK